MGQMPNSESDQLTVETRLLGALQATSVFLVPLGMIFVRKRKAYVYEIFLRSLSSSILLPREVQLTNEVKCPEVSSALTRGNLAAETAKISAPEEYHFFNNLF